MRKHLSTVLLILILVTGVSLLLYPTISDYWNSMFQSKAIATYTEEVAQMDDEIYETMWENAKVYNDTLARSDERFVFYEEEKLAYERLLNVAGNGIMGYIQIPAINCSLPVYHGTSEEVLQIAIGHIEGSSLPVGGEGSHCVLSGHRGLPRAKLFTEIDKLREGDVFMLQVLDETLTYEVDKIWIVEPHEIDKLGIEEGKDYCTLVTCTPYGVNSHRLLVRGSRVENRAADKVVRVSADAVQIDPVLVAPVMSIPIFFAFLGWVLIKYRK